MDFVGLAAHIWVPAQGRIFFQNHVGLVWRLVSKANNAAARAMFCEAVEAYVWADGLPFPCISETRVFHL